MIFRVSVTVDFKVLPDDLKDELKASLGSSDFIEFVNGYISEAIATEVTDVVVGIEIED